MNEDFQPNTNENAKWCWKWDHYAGISPDVNADSKSQNSYAAQFDFSTSKSLQAAADKIIQIEGRITTESAAVGKKERT